VSTTVFDVASTLATLNSWFAWYTFGRVAL
jgi:hypothetical protein